LAGVPGTAHGACRQPARGPAAAWHGPGRRPRRAWSPCSLRRLRIAPRATPKLKRASSFTPDLL